ncbi:hypothetical protein SNK03_010149 [Fusarium graminearum]|uniref:Mating-type switching protein swi10 n=2 Tax=Fusarium sambucinum species complex TaxID=569360 RepID=A0A2H3GYQ2_GIBZA|nr:hypothetical protein FAUST_9833 [Fusarium austroamericanum]KAI6748048.1 hypothetical protein HG531_008590 [Fusarium graminearum]PCD32104.1 hypothetical protein FGRA07_09356 [Fusarium graminearum]CAF3626051.1 unnamed protein product [Fusarium graminearum]CAF3642530.1 unnamed protein product [Fusarium graminearum]
MENSLAKSNSLKPPRRKLQKADPKLKSLNKAKRGSTDSHSSSTMASLSPMSSPTQHHMSNGAPDLSDSKWDHYLRPKTVFVPSFSEAEEQHSEENMNQHYHHQPVQHPEPSPRAACFSPPPQGQSSFHRQIPEFHHLTLHEHRARPSLDRSSLPSTASTTSTSSAMRRQAKTPVFRIGQLEQHALARKAKDVQEKTSSVELIADQYHALLETRDGPPALDSQLPSRASSQYSFDDTPLQIPPYAAKRSQSMRTAKTSSSMTAIPRQLRPRLRSAPTHDTNVAAVEGDTIYFKPYSFSPPPSPEYPGTPRHSWTDEFRPSSSSGHSFQDNISLQIAFDLLTSELSSVMTGRPQRNGQDTAALQIWVMIEAYERLRDQLTRQEPSNAEAQKVATMFDCWLASLYSIHSSLTESTLPSPTEYAGLEEELD